MNKIIKLNYSTYRYIEIKILKIKKKITKEINGRYKNESR
jgi:hypothetical protein